MSLTWLSITVFLTCSLCFWLDPSTCLACRQFDESLHGWVGVLLSGGAYSHRLIVALSTCGKKKTTGTLSRQGH